MIFLNLIDQAHTPPAQLTAAKAAITLQANEDLRPAWGTQPIRFAKRGWKVTLLPNSRWPKSYSAYAGFHYISGPTNTPYAEVNRSNPNWTVTTSHEVVEMLVDPYLWRTIPIPANDTRELAEIGDPVNNHSYSISGVAVSDFVLPSWFEPGTPGPWDWTGVTRAPLQPARGGYLPASRSRK
jgi:hypothetical protein